MTEDGTNDSKWNGGHHNKWLRIGLEWNRKERENPQHGEEISHTKL